MRLKRDDLQIPVIFLTMHAEAAYARRALEGGAAGYVLKHSAPAELITAIRAALNGKTYVSPAVAGEVLRIINQKPGKADDPVASLTPTATGNPSIVDGRAVRRRRLATRWRFRPHRGVP